MNLFIEKFLLHLKSQRNFSRHTIKAYKFDLNEFSEFAQKYNISNPEKIDRLLLRNYIAHIQEKKVLRNTLLRKISSVRSFINYLIMEGIVEFDPFEIINIPRKEKRLPKFLTESEVRKLIDSNKPEQVLLKDRNYKFAVRDFAILEIMYSSGLRRSEISNLNIGDVDFLSGFVRVLGKGSKERIVPVGDNALMAVKNYLNTRKSTSPGMPLFLNHRGNRLSDSGIELIVKRMAKRARFSRPLNAHAIRHTFATHLLDRGCDLKSVQEMLGHKNLSTTEIYTHVSLDRLRQVYNKTHPLAKR